MALYLKSIGWKDVRLSPGSRGPADIVASCTGSRWFIQVKASEGLPRLRAREMNRLRNLAKSHGGLAVVSTLQPFGPGSFKTGNFEMIFYELETWRVLDPVTVPGDTNSSSWDAEYLSLRTTIKASDMTTRC